MSEATLSLRFGRVLQKHRIAKKLTQEAVAEKANIHPTHVGLIERGLRNPSLNVCAALAEALNVDLAVLIAEAQRLRIRN